jgi:hypothetical protein
LSGVKVGHAGDLNIVRADGGGSGHCRGGLQ